MKIVQNLKLLSTMLGVSFCLVACNGGSNSVAPQQTLTVDKVARSKSAQSTTNNIPTNLVAIAKGNGVYVAVGNKGSILTSSDGKTWNSQSTGVSIDLHDIIFNNSNKLFYAVGDKSTLLSSPDGITWTLYNQLNPVKDLYSLVAVNGYLIVGAESSDIYEIDLGGRSTVTVRNTVDNIKLISVATNDSVIILGGNDGSIVYKKISQLASGNWNRATKMSGSITGLSFSKIDNWLIATTSFGTVTRSTDGITGWSTPVTASNDALNSVAVDPISNDFIAVGKSIAPLNIVNSSNFNAWSYYTESYPADLNQVNCFEIDCFIVGNDSLILKSAPRTGVTAPVWQQVNKILSFGSGFIPRYPAANQSPTSSAYGNGIFVIGSAAATTNWGHDFYGYVSKNGADWKQFVTPQQIQIVSMVFAAEKFVALGGGGVNKDGIWQADNVLTSMNGLEWSVQKLPQKKYWYSITYGNGKFVAISDIGNIAAYSNNGESWSQSTLPYSSYWRSVAYGNGLFLAVTRGRNGLSATSNDGINWQAATNFPTSTSNSASLIFANGKFVLQGVASQYYTTINGSKWDGPYSYPCSDGANTGVISNGSNFIDICNSNYYSSTDAINWKLDYSNIGNYNSASWVSFASSDNLALFLQANGSFLSIK